MILVSVVILILVGSILIFLVSATPMGLLESDQPDEYKRIKGKLAILGRNYSIQYIFYLALNDYKKNIHNQDIVRQLRPAAWVAKLLILSVIVLLVLMISP